MHATPTHIRSALEARDEPIRRPGRNRSGRGLIAVRLAGQVPADEAAFTFRVPVNVQRIHEHISKVRVARHVRGDTDAVPRKAEYVDRVLANGAYIGPVTAIIMRNRVVDPSLYTQWGCRLFYLVGTGANPEVLAPSTEADAPIWQRVQERGVDRMAWMPFPE